MSLGKYKHKRKFNKTPEPEGKVKEGKGLPHFVVQKHQASHLHYDFRVEAGGVLKSWAVPKGPSLNPDDKRLAMMVEDHPIEYRTFEGVIPEGNYGAGEVIVWDAGIYRTYEEGKNRKEIEKEVLDGIKKGHITIILEGKKLKGEFALVKIKPRSGSKPNSWLLIKANDEIGRAHV